MAYDVAAVRAVLAPHLEDAGLDLEDLRITNAGPKSVIAVVVDSDSGPTLDELARVARVLSDAVDGADHVFGGQGFTLEVTTPGAERSLSQPRHWRRAQGRLAAVTFTDRTELVARIGELNTADSVITLVVPGGKKSAPTTRQVSVAAVADAVVRVEFRPPDPRELELSGLTAGRVAPGSPPTDVGDSVGVDGSEE